jgi:hypothetical protein
MCSAALRLRSHTHSCVPAHHRRGSSSHLRRPARAQATCVAIPGIPKSDCQTQRHSYDVGGRQLQVKIYLYINNSRRLRHTSPPHNRSLLSVTRQFQHGPKRLKRDTIHTVDTYYRRKTHRAGSKLITRSARVDYNAHSSEEHLGQSEPRPLYPPKGFCYLHDQCS